MTLKCPLGGLLSCIIFYLRDYDISDVFSFHRRTDSPVAMTENNKTKKAQATAAYDQLVTGGNEVLHELVSGLDSWWIVELLDRDIHTLFGLGMAESNSANSCFDGMPSRPVDDTELARGSTSSIAVAWALSDDGPTQLSSRLIDSGDLMGASRGAAGSTFVAVSPTAIATVFFSFCLGLGLFLVLVEGAMAADVIPKRGK